MYLQRKFHLRSINRVRIRETRDLNCGLRLDRNEKVGNWPEDFLQKVFANKPDCFLSVYPDSDIIYRKLSGYLGIPESRLMLTSGIDGAMKTLYEIVTKPGDTIGVISPTYAMYAVYCDLFQLNLFKIGYRPDLTLNFNQIDECLELHPTLLFIPNPNQPIESVMTLPELDELAQRASKINCLLVIDEAYHLFGCDGAISLVDEHDNVVVMRTFSKAFGLPSIRTGFIVASEDNMQVLSKTRYAHEGNALSYAVIEYVLDHMDLVYDYIDEINEGRELVRGELEKMGFTTHGQKGNFFLIDLLSNELAKHTVQFLKDKRIYVKGPWADPWSQYISITLGPPQLMQPFILAMQEVRTLSPISSQLMECT